jgi:hypothetical protein
MGLYPFFFIVLLVISFQPELWPIILPTRITRHVRLQLCLSAWIYSRSTVFVMMANLAVWESRLLHLATPS